MTAECANTESRDRTGCSRDVCVSLLYVHSERDQALHCLVHDDREIM